MTDDARRTIRFTLNGRSVTASIAVYETVVDVLQREFALLGARESCGQGLCGCCTVLVDGTAVSGCLYLAAFVDEADVVTIEGLASADGTLNPVQQAVLDGQGFQCAFCMSGFIMATTGFLKTNPNPTRAELAHGISGNLCRCADYNKILDCMMNAAELARRA